MPFWGGSWLAGGPHIVNMQAEGRKKRRGLRKLMPRHSPVMPSLVDKDFEQCCATNNIQISTVPPPPPRQPPLANTADRPPISGNEPGPQTSLRSGSRFGTGSASVSNAMAVSTCASSDPHQWISPPAGGTYRSLLCPISRFGIGGGDETVLSEREGSGSLSSAMRSFALTGLGGNNGMVSPQQMFQTESEEQLDDRSVMLASAESDLAAAYFGQLNVAAVAQAQRRALGAAAAQSLARHHPMSMDSPHEALIMAQNVLSYAAHEVGGLVGTVNPPPELHFWQGNLDPSSMKVSCPFPRFAPALDEFSPYEAHAEDMLRHIPYHAYTGQEHSQPATRLGTDGGIVQVSNSGWLPHDWALGSADHPINMSDALCSGQGTSWSEAAAFSPWVSCPPAFDTEATPPKSDTWHDVLPPVQSQICTRGQKALANGVEIESTMHSSIDSASLLDIPGGMLLESGDINMCPLDGFATMPVQDSTSTCWDAVKGAGQIAGSEMGPLVVVKSEVFTEVERGKGEEKGSEEADNRGRAGRKRTWKEGGKECEVEIRGLVTTKSGEKRSRSGERQEVGSGDSEVEKVSCMMVDGSQAADAAQGDITGRMEQSSEQSNIAPAVPEPAPASLRRSPSLLSRTCSMTEQAAVDAPPGDVLFAPQPPVAMECSAAEAAASGPTGAMASANKSDESAKKKTKSRRREGESETLCDQITEKAAHGESGRGNGGDLPTEGWGRERKSMMARSLSWPSRKDGKGMTLAKQEAASAQWGAGAEADAGGFVGVVQDGNSEGKGNPKAEGLSYGVGGASGFFPPGNMENADPTPCPVANAAERAPQGFGLKADGANARVHAHGDQCECYECVGTWHQAQVAAGVSGAATCQPASLPVKQEWGHSQLLVRSVSQPESSSNFLNPRPTRRGSRACARSAGAQIGGSGGMRSSMAPPPQQFLGSQQMIPFPPGHVSIPPHKEANKLRPIQPMIDTRLGVGSPGYPVGEAGMDESELRDLREVVLVRAKRGQATDSHSLAERARREKINQKMKVLLELVPSCEKINGMSSQLGEIIEYVKNLKAENQMLSRKLVSMEQEICNTDGGISMGPASPTDYPTTTSTTQDPIPPQAFKPTC